MTAIELAEHYLGNVNERTDVAAWVALAKQSGQYLEVQVERSDRIKGRIRTQTADGQAVGIVKSRDWLLKEGDVLETAEHKLVFVTIQPQEVIALKFDEGARNPAIALIHLGHTLGNQHWPISVHHDTLYVEQVAAAETMEKIIQNIVETLSIQGLSIHYETKSAADAVDFSGPSTDISAHQHHPHQHHPH